MTDPPSQPSGYVAMCQRTGSIFPETRIGDMVVFGCNAAQRIHMGTHAGGVPALTVGTQVVHSGDPENTVTVKGTFRAASYAGLAASPTYDAPDSANVPASALSVRQLSVITDALASNLQTAAEAGSYASNIATGASERATFASNLAPQLAQAIADATGATSNAMFAVLPDLSNVAYGASNLAGPLRNLLPDGSDDGELVLPSNVRVQGRLAVAGDMDFGGSLLHQGAPAVFSQWTTGIAGTAGAADVYLLGSNVGVGTSQPLARLHVAGGGTLIDGALTATGTLNALGGARMGSILPRIGGSAPTLGASGSQWDTVHVGQGGVEVGRGAIVSGGPAGSTPVAMGRMVANPSGVGGIRFIAPQSLTPGGLSPILASSVRAHNSTVASCPDCDITLGAVPSRPPLLRQPATGYSDSNGTMVTALAGGVVECVSTRDGRVVEQFVLETSAVEGQPRPLSACPLQLVVGASPSSPVVLLASGVFSPLLRIKVVHRFESSSTRTVVSTTLADVALPQLCTHATLAMGLNLTDGSPPTVLWSSLLTHVVLGAATHAGAVLLAPFDGDDATASAAAHAASRAEGWCIAAPPTHPMLRAAHGAPGRGVIAGYGGEGEEESCMVVAYTARTAAPLNAPVPSPVPLRGRHLRVSCIGGEEGSGGRVRLLHVGHAGAQGRLLWLAHLWIPAVGSIRVVSEPSDGGDGIADQTCANIDASDLMGAEAVAAGDEDDAGSLLRQVFLLSAHDTPCTPVSSWSWALRCHDADAGIMPPHPVVTCVACDPLEGAGAGTATGGGVVVCGVLPRAGIEWVPMRSLGWGGAMNNAPVPLHPPPTTDTGSGSGSGSDALCYVSRFSGDWGTYQWTALLASQTQGRCVAAAVDGAQGDVFVVVGGVGASLLISDGTGTDHQCPAAPGSRHAILKLGGSAGGALHWVAYDAHDTDATDVCALRGGWGAAVMYGSATAMQVTCMASADGAPRWDVTMEAVGGGVFVAPDVASRQLPQQHHSMVAMPDQGVAFVVVRDCALPAEAHSPPRAVDAVFTRWLHSGVPLATQARMEPPPPMEGMCEGNNDHVMALVVRVDAQGQVQ